MADPGSVYISGGIYEQVKYKLVCGYQSLGDRKVKNITEPIPIYRVLPDPAAVTKATTNRRLRLGLLAVIAVIVCGIGGGWYVFRLQAKQPVLRSDLSRADTQSASPHVATVLPAEELALQSPKPVLPTPNQKAGTPDVNGQAPAPAVNAPEMGAVAPTTTDSKSEQQGHNESPPMQQALVLQRVEPPVREGPAPVKEPEMVAVPGGSFKMGSNEDRSEQPVHRVSIKPVLIGKYPVTVGEWQGCVLAKACTHIARGDDEAPVSNVSWDDAQQFTAWLSQATGKNYRLLSEAEWEYAARAGTETAYWWGNSVKPGMAGCKGCGEPYDFRQPRKPGSFPPNPFGLYDMGGGVAEWVADCWHKDYHGAPTDGSPWTAPDCRDHVLRGGSWRDDPTYARVSSREYYDTGVRYVTHGFRVARSP